MGNKAGHTMRIGYDAKRLFSNFSGLGNYSRTLLKNLAQYAPHNEYHLYTPRIRNTSATEFFLNNSAYKCFHYQGMLGAFWRSAGIKKQIRKDRIDLFHGLSHELPFGIHRSKIKSIVTIHDLVFKIFPETYPPLDRRIYDLKTRYSCKHADRIIAISHNTKKDIVKYYDIDPGKIDVVYQSCDPIYYETEEPTGLELSELPNEYLLCVGTIKDRKNLKTLIKAFDMLPNDLKIPLVVVGQGRDKKAVRELMAAIGSEKLLIWLDSLQDDRQLRHVYMNAAVFIYPSLYEGFGLPVAEALLCRTPVVASNSSSLPEAGGADSVYFDPTDPEALVEAMERVLIDDALRETMGENGYAYATREFDPVKLSKQMAGIYAAFDRS